MNKLIGLSYNVINHIAFSGQISCPSEPLAFHLYRIQKRVRLLSSSSGTGQNRSRQPQISQNNQQ